MGNNDHGDAGFRQRADDFQHLAHHLRIQSGGGLIKQNQVRLHAQGTGDGDALLLAAGKLRRLGVAVGAHAHYLEIFPCQSLGFFLALLAYQLGADHAVFQGAHIGEEIERLEHHPHAGTEPVFILGTVRHGLALKNDLAATGGFQHIDAAQQRGFSGTGGSDHADDLALLHFKINVLQDLMGAEAFFQMLDLQDCFTHDRATSTSSFSSSKISS